MLEQSLSFSVETRKISYSFFPVSSTWLNGLLKWNFCSVFLYMLGYESLLLALHSKHIQSFHVSRLTWSPSCTVLSAAPAEGRRGLLFENGLAQQSVQILPGEVQLLGGWNWRLKACRGGKGSHKKITFSSSGHICRIVFIQQKQNKPCYLCFMINARTTPETKKHNLNYKIHIMLSLVFVGSSSLVQRPVSSDGQWAAATACTWGTASMESWRRIFEGDKNLPNQTNPGIHNPNGRDVQLLSLTKFSLLPAGN